MSSRAERLHLPDALSPHTLHATKVFVPVDELDELESAADDVVVVVFEDDVGENGWPSTRKDKNVLVKTSRQLMSFKSRWNSLIYLRACSSRDNWK